MDKVKWGIIGCGDVTEIKSGPAFNLVDNSDLVAVMRRNGDKAKNYAERHNVPKWYDDADKLINDKDVNAVYVATPPSSHAEYTLKAAEAGKPVYVEKPMAADYGECLKMIQACEKNNVPLYVAYYRRELPYFKKVHSLIEQNEIGEIRAVNIKLHWPVKDEEKDKDNLPWRVLPETAGAGYFYDLASHQFDYLDLIFGPVKNSLGIKANQAGLYPAEDNVQAVFEFENGIVGNGSWCFTAGENVEYERTSIVGSTGEIEFSFFDQNPIIVTNAGGRKEITENFPKHIQQPLIKTVVDDLTGKGSCRSTGNSGARTNRVMDKILGKLK